MQTHAFVLDGNIYASPDESTYIYSVTLLIIKYKSFLLAICTQPHIIATFLFCNDISPFLTIIYNIMTLLVNVRTDQDLL